MNKAYKATFLGAAFALTFGGLALVSPAAHASNSNSATTAITNNYDSGGQGYWANDNFARTLTFAQEDPNYCTSEGLTIPSGDVCDEVSISDSGAFTTLNNAFQPNQGFGAGAPSNKTILNVVNGTFTGSDSWAIVTPSTNEPDPSLVTGTLNDNYTHPPSGKTSTSQWYLQAFASPPTAVQPLNWNWTYITSNCGEQWVDSSASGAGNNGFDGQSSPISVDGNVTGLVSGDSGCTPPIADQVTVANPGSQSTTTGNSVSLQLIASSNKGDNITGFTATGLPAGLSISNGGLITGTAGTSESTTVTVTATDTAGTTGSTSFTWSVGTPVTITFGTYGNNVNKFGNGFDVFKQHAAPNTPIVGWPATQADPATHFIKNAEGSDFQFEYAPNGVGDGLCVSNPGNGALVLRSCNSNVWQEFVYSGGHVVSVVNGGIVNPDGTGAQLTTGSSATPWGGSNYTWTAFSSLPA